MKRSLKKTRGDREEEGCRSRVAAPAADSNPRLCRPDVENARMGKRLLCCSNGRPRAHGRRSQSRSSFIFIFPSTTQAGGPFPDTYILPVLTSTQLGWNARLKLNVNFEFVLHLDIPPSGLPPFASPRANELGVRFRVWVGRTPYPVVAILHDWGIETAGHHHSVPDHSAGVTSISPPPSARVRVRAPPQVPQHVSCTLPF